MPTEEIVTEPTPEVVKPETETFLKGIKTNQEFYFSSDKKKEIMTKKDGLFYQTENGKVLKGSAMDKCVIV